jgi:hypothetical protein
MATARARTGKAISSCRLVGRPIALYLASSRQPRRTMLSVQRRCTARRNRKSGRKQPFVRENRPSVVAASKEMLRFGCERPRSCGPGDATAKPWRRLANAGRA